MSRNDDELPISEDDARFVRKLDTLYEPPARTAAERARFQARLSERLAWRNGRTRWWLAGAMAGATAALLLALLPGVERDEPAPLASQEAVPAAFEPDLTTEETLLELANGPLGDPDDALPEDYRTLASLLE